MYQVLKARVRAQAVKYGSHIHTDQDPLVLLIGFLQPCESLLFIPETDYKQLPGQKPTTTSLWTSHSFVLRLGLADASPHASPGAPAAARSGYRNGWLPAVARQQITGLSCSGGIHCFTAAVDTADDARSIYHEGCTFGDAQKAKHTILAADFLLGVAKQRKRKAQLLRKTAIGLRFVDTDTEHLGARAFETGKTILVCLELLRSPRRVGIDEESQDSALPAPEIAEPDHPARVIRQFEIWCRVSDVQYHPGFFFLNTGLPAAVCSD